MKGNSPGTYHLPNLPFDVPHLELGYYFGADPLLFFPTSTFHLSMVYEIWNDAGYTVKSNSHAPVVEHYSKADTSVGIDPELLDKLNQIIDIVTSHDVNSQIIGEMFDDTELDGIVLENDVMGYLFDEQVLTGIVVEDTIGGLVDDGDNLSGIIES